MTLWSFDELMHLTRDELCDLASQLEHRLGQFSLGFEAKQRLLMQLESVRRVMELRGLHF